MPTGAHHLCRAVVAVSDVGVSSLASWRLLVGDAMAGRIVDQTFDLGKPAGPWGGDRPLVDIVVAVTIQL